ncbi:MAG: ABC transporter substrate-binding protein [Cyanobacteria bacterium]|nr:ABC transporter substrate-binding protein [Cyanobacteriota bacterium]MDW8202768.1 ABC transporter substrate-binding protein [Cyanobacteriota bacterium SKYGB_h_bin112]
MGILNPRLRKGRGRSPWWLVVLLGLVVMGLVVGCQQPRLQTPTNRLGDTSTAVVQPCVTSYSPDRDYFPNKVKFSYAQGVRVDYHRHYKVVAVPGQMNQAPITYVLVQCGTPIPTEIKGTVITVPIATIAALSSTYLPHLDVLGLLDRLVAIDYVKQINNPKVRELVKQGKVHEVGADNTVNVEQLLNLDPSLVMTYQLSGAAVDYTERLARAGMTVAVNAEYLETSPLGRAEWLKFTALFFNQEAAANRVFAGIVERYRRIAAMAARVSDRPTVMAGLDIGGTWYMPGGKSYMARYFRDAGANYLWADNPATGSIPLSFEAVLDRASQAQFWFTSSLTWQTQADILAADPRYQNFTAVQTKQVFNNNARVNATGGNDYWESGILQPDVVLSDLVKILHPQLLPSHQLVYYRRLE